MLAEINNTPSVLKFLIGSGLIGILFGTSAADTIGINPHWQVPVVILLMIVLLIWIFLGERRSKNTEPAE